jgi:hypothetical protein
MVRPPDDGRSGHNVYVRLEVFTEVRMLVLSCVLTPCKLVRRYRLAEDGDSVISETLASTNESVRRENPEQHRNVNVWVINCSQTV